jgi:hypothetical protein
MPKLRTLTLSLTESLAESPDSGEETTAFAVAAAKGEDFLVSPLRRVSASTNRAVGD